MAAPKTPDNTGGADVPPASDPAVNLDEERPGQPADTTHPRRVRPPRRRPADKQLRPDRVRGGFDTKG